MLNPFYTILGITYYAISVLSNSSLYYDNKNLYWLKHLFVISVALLSIKLLCRYKSSEMHAVSLLAFLSISYFVFYGSPVLSFQIVLFILFINVISRFYESINYKVILIMFLILITPLILDVVYNYASNIYTDKYGRYRLQLGFNHPKEAANSVLVFVSVLWCGWLRERGLLLKVTFFSSLVVLLYFMQSRNALLFLLIVSSISLIRSYVTASLILFITLLGVGLIVFQIILFWDEFDVLSSGRLSLWERELVGVEFIKVSDKLNFDLSTYNIDNFFVSYIVQNGVFSFMVFMVFLVFSFIKLSSYKFSGISAFAILFGMSINSVFDSGFVSTGSIFNIFLWGMVLYILRSSRSINDRLGVRNVVES
jgi:hypothetical protein